MIQYFPDEPIESSINDVIDELNRQQKTNTLPLSIVAYDTITLSINPGDRGNPIVLFGHNLGYAPLFQVFVGNLSLGGITSVPVVDAFDDGGGGLRFAGTVNAFVDNLNLYIIWWDQLQTNQQQLTYVLYSGSIPNQ